MVGAAICRTGAAGERDADVLFFVVATGVNSTGAAAVPTTLSVPSTKMLAPAATVTMLPAATVSVLPAPIVKSAVMV